MQYTDGVPGVESAEGPLAGVRVVEFNLGSTRGVAVAGRALADLGADVFATVPPANLTDSLAASKRVAARALTTDEMVATLGECDVLLTSKAGYQSLALSGVLDDERNCALVVTCVSPFGLTGPSSDLPAGELVLQAVTAIMMTNGEQGEPPLPTGVPIAAFGGGILATIATVAALYERGKSGRGQLVDQAEYDAVVAFLGTLLPTYFLTGGTGPRLGNRHAMAAPWSVYRTLDAWLIVCTITDTQFHALATAMSRRDLVSDPRFASAALRVENVVALDEQVSAWTSSLTTEVALTRLDEAGVSAGRILSVPEMLAHPHARWRRVVAAIDGLPVAAPFLRFGLDGEGIRPRRPVIVEGSQPLWRKPWSPPVPLDRHSSEAAGPLAGVRVVEVAAHTAGPLAGRLLGLLGAEVIKVEPLGGEATRHLGQRVAGQGYLFHVNNTDKRGITLDIGNADGRAQLLALLETSDAFVTNLAPNTLATLGLDPATVMARLPRLVYGALSGFGSTGPYGGRKAFDMVVQALSGHMWLTPNDQGEPSKIGVSIVDLFGGCSAALGIAAALVARRTTGRGTHVDAALFDVATWLTQDSWRATDEAGALARLGGTRVSTLDGFLFVDGALDPDEVSRLTGMTSERALRELIACGRPAAIPLSLRDVAEAALTAERKLLTNVAYEGTLLRVIDSPFAFSRSHSAVRRAAPELGADNDAIFGEGR